MCGVGGGDAVRVVGGNIVVVEDVVVGLMVGGSRSSIMTVLGVECPGTL